MNQLYPIEYINENNKHTSVKIKQRLIHSTYDPIKEAARVFAPQLKSQPSDWNGNFLIIGGGLGYEISFLRTQYPKARISSIFFTEEFLRKNNADDSYLYTGNNKQTNADAALKRFLYRQCESGKRPQTLLWSPSSNVWPEHCKKILSYIDTSFARLRAQDETSQFFAARWLRNAFQNIEMLAKSPRRPFTLRHKHSIVVAAGPSLNEQFPLIRRLSADHNILCVGSALSACFSHGIFPSLVFHQDASYHAAYLLRDALLMQPDAALRVVFPLSAAPLDDVCIPYPVRVNDELDDVFGSSLRYHSSLSQFATVTGLALQYALSMTKGFVVLAGFDMKNHLQGTHCLPHPRLNPLVVGNKLEPFAHYQSAPYLSKKNDGGLKIYNNWFSKEWKERKNPRLKVLLPSKAIVGKSFDSSSYQLECEMFENRENSQSYSKSIKTKPEQSKSQSSNYIDSSKLIRTLDTSIEKNYFGRVGFTPTLPIQNIIEQARQKLYARLKKQ